MKLYVLSTVAHFEIDPVRLNMEPGNGALEKEGPFGKTSIFDFRGSDVVKFSSPYRMFNHSVLWNFSCSPISSRRN